jgi:diguanylate cyclase (GGDEF)-like protein
MYVTVATYARHLEEDPAREELARQNDELAALHETALALIDGLDLESVLEAIVVRAGALVGCPDGWVSLRDPDADVLITRVGTGVFVDCVGDRVQRGEGIGGHVLASGEPVAVDDYRSWPGRSVANDALSLGAVAGVPLCAGSEVIGVLGLARTGTALRFETAEIELLSRFGRLASLALENARLYAEAQRELVERRRAEEELRSALASLRQSDEELRLTREQMIRRLANAAEFRDVETGRHVERMGRYAGLLAHRLGLDDRHCELIKTASPLHDIGKIGIADAVLRKRGLLTEAERREMERHAEIGYRLLAESGSELLELAARIAWTHHERFDGTGYPRGLAGEAIPLEGRIAAVADVFDALTSDRPYRPAFAPEEAIRLMLEGRGSHFDPRVLDAFLDALHEVRQDSEEVEAGTPTPVVLSVTDLGSTPRDTLTVAALRTAADEASRLLAAAAHDRQAIDAALGRLRELVPELLVSVYAREHDRLWCVAQRGYDEVRDGYRLDQGIMGRAVRTGHVQLIADVRRDGDFIEAAPEILSELAIPFGDGLGVFNVETRQLELPPEAVGAFDRLARALGSKVAALGTGIRVDLGSLARLFVYAGSLKGEGEIAEFSTRTLGRLLDLDAAQLDLCHNDTGYVLASFWRESDSDVEPIAPSRLDQIARLVDPTGAAYNILDLRSVHLESGPDEGWPWLLWLPLEVAGGRVGVLVGRSEKRLNVEPANVDAATLFAPHAAALIDAAQAIRREQRVAVTDSLTGLLNRRGFEQRFREEIKRAERAGRELGVVILDCDGLKAINDRGGHQLGDSVLVRVARCLKTQKRVSDIAGRLGGDEFAVLLPEVDGDGTVLAAERLRRSIVAQVLEDGQLVTATFGVAVYPTDGKTPGALLRAADQALYLAKAAGRNRTGVFGQPEPVG